MVMTAEFKVKLGEMAHSKRLHTKIFGRKDLSGCSVTTSSYTKAVCAL